VRGIKFTPNAPPALSIEGRRDAVLRGVELLLVAIDQPAKSERDDMEEQEYNTQQALENLRTAWRLYQATIRKKARK
jgi:hypothetical protein